MPTSLEEQNVAVVQELLADISDKEIRELCIVALRNWKRKYPDENQLSMHGGLGLELVPLLIARKGRAPMNDDVLSGLKEPFITQQTMPWFTGVADFMSWFVRAGYGDVISSHRNNIITLRLTRRGIEFLELPPASTASARDNALMATDREESRRQVMANKPDLDHARLVLEDGGWVVPREVTPLARGGGGTVYKCYRRSLIEAIADLRDPSSEGTLLIDEVLAAGPETACAALKIAHRFDERLAREISAMQRVEDKHLVRVLARDGRPSPVWFLMEFIGGGSLHARLSDYHGDASKTLRSVLPVVKALGHLHRAGLVHRDVKTKNIFLRHSGDLVLGDLGIVFDSEAARLTTYESPMSRDWTPRWRAEDLNTPARDVYSVARVIYAMLSGDKIVEPEWLSEREYQIASMFPDDPAMPIIDDLLARHITPRKTNCASENGDAFAAAIEAALEATSRGRQMMPVVLWGLGETTPGSGTNKSLENLPILIPPWTRRLTARVRYRHPTPPKVECTFAVVLEDGATRLESSMISMTPHVWADASVDVPKRRANDWCIFSLRSEYAALISEFSLYALNY